MKQTEAIITVVGFLGAGKTTLLKYLVNEYIGIGWEPYVILNDYENAYMDAQQFTDQLQSNTIKALNGSCICCSGIIELRNTVNRIPERKNGVTLIEANGTSDTCALMEFLAVGLKDHFLPPVQIGVVDVKNWQQRGEHNELEANQIQVSSLIVLTHLDSLTKNAIEIVKNELRSLNPAAQLIPVEALDVSLLPELLPSENKAQQFEHQKSHWSSCSVDLPMLPNIECIYDICNMLPMSMLRVKGCTMVVGDDFYTYFERKPDGEIHIRPFNGVPITGNKLLTVGNGSDPEILNKAIQVGMNAVH